MSHVICDKYSRMIAGIFRRFQPQLLHIILLPISFFAFMLIYTPSGIVSFLGQEWFGVHLTIMSSILLLAVTATRLLYYFLPMKLNYTLYTFWCLGEIIFASFFVALYLWLVLHKPMLYFDVLTTSFKYLFLSLSISYAIIALSMRVYEYHNRAADSAYSVVRRLRFYDNQHNLKLVIMPQSLLYIEAEENYVRINYVENERSKEFVLRSSMKSLDETCQEYGMVRCHRSFYINPAHIKVLRKDKDGIMYAELDADDVRTIPVSKTYYKMLSDML